MKFKIINIKGLVFVTCLMALSMMMITSCSDDDEKFETGYGYVQFKLFKSSSYLKSTQIDNNQMQYLDDAEKMKIILINSEDGSEVTQTLGLNKIADDAEEGLRSDNLQLMAGDYTIVGFYIYSVNGQQLELVYSGEPDQQTILTVTTGGLSVQDLQIQAVERGRINFSLSKKILPNTNSANNADKFMFSQIAYASITIKDLFTKDTQFLEYLPFSYEEQVVEDGYLTAVAKADTLILLRAGNYQVLSYSIYDKNKSTLDADNLIDETIFEISDNQNTEADVPVNIYQSAAYIQDYIALRQIWEALDGPDWNYQGEGYTNGINWDFDKDIDFWGDQPGVGLNDNGRVITLNLGSFGGRGMVPDAIGQLEELKILTLGTHSDLIGNNMIEQWEGEPTASQKLAWRNDFYERFIKKDIKTQFSEPLQFAFELQGKAVENTASETTQPSISTKDVVPGNLSNGITSVSKEISKLSKLQQLFIANGKFIDFEDGTDFSAMDDLTDVEFYNCPSMKTLPEALFTMPNIELLNLSNNPQIAAADIENGLDQLAQSPTAGKLQILYLRNNNLTTLPQSVRNFKKLGKLDCAYNKLVSIPAFGEDIKLVQLTMDYNQITEIPNIDGYFCGYDDVEDFSFAHNKLKEFPNIFSANSLYTMESVDFSFNEIEGFQDEENFKGIKVATLSLAGNRLKTFPGILFNTDSYVNALTLSGNGIETFPEEALEGENTYCLESLDLTYNKLTELPDNFNAVLLPYLYGIDLSHNRFDYFPKGPLNISRLTVFALRSQHDADGNKIMREWPTGIYTCPSLRALYVGDNDLRKIDDTISPNIYIFEIIDNPNISIDLTDICPYIKAGYYTLIYDPTQDIRGCDYLNLN